MSATLKNRIVIIVKGWLFSVVIAILIATSVKSSLADWNDIPSGSMEPTILVGDRVVVNKLAYDLKLPCTTVHLAKWANPERGDIVVFFSPKNGQRLIKRVVGLPGDTIAMWRNRLMINGQTIDYNPLQRDAVDPSMQSLTDQRIFLSENLQGKEHLVMLSPQNPSLSTFSPVTIPEGQYFMMGDNRDNSADSRFFGFVDRKLIVGRATMIALSRDQSFLHPRWSRFFNELI